MAEALLDNVLGEGNYEVLETMKGKELEYMRYEPLFSFLENDPKAFIVTCDPYVTLTDGTGVVRLQRTFPSVCRRCRQHDKRNRSFCRHVR